MDDTTRYLLVELSAANREIGTYRGIIEVLYERLGETPETYLPAPQEGTDTAFRAYLNGLHQEQQHTRQMLQYWNAEAQHVALLLSRLSEAHQWQHEQTVLQADVQQAIQRVLPTGKLSDAGKGY